MTPFENAIKDYLDARAKEDVKFAEKYSNGKKSIEECCRFILGEMKKKAAGGMYGADLLRDTNSDVWSCSRSGRAQGWFVNGYYGDLYRFDVWCSFLAVPVILY